MTDAEQIHILARQRAIMFDVAFRMGHRWASMKHDDAMGIMRDLDGPDGIRKLASEWVSEFDHHWSVLPAEAHGGYAEEINDYTHEQIDRLIALVSQNQLVS